MTHWSYKIDVIRWGREVDGIMIQSDTDLEAFLNHRGNYGWELISEHQTDYLSRYVWKRHTP